MVFQSIRYSINNDYGLSKKENELKKSIGANISLKEIYLRTKDNILIHLIFFNNPNKKSCILYSHGNGSSIKQRLNLISTFAPYCSFIMYDYRGYGKSMGKTTEKGTHRDIKTVWKYVIETLKIDPYHITLYGTSLGASVTAYLGQKLCKKNIKPYAIVMEAGFSDIRRVAQDKFNSFLANFMVCSFDSKKYVSKIGNKIPILIFHSRDDELISFYHKDVLINYNKNIKFHEIKGTHSRPIRNSEYIEKFIQYLNN